MATAGGHPTGLLHDHLAGDEKAADRLLPLVYGELRAIASRLLRDERSGHTLDATAVVHEAYLRMIDDSQIDCRGRTHFLAIAAGALRRVLVDSARAKRAQKRGGGRQQLTLRDLGSDPEKTLDLIALDEALERLGLEHPRPCKIVELRYFGGLSVGETAQVLGVSERTVKRGWRLARAWLLDETGSKGDRP